MILLTSKNPSTWTVLVFLLVFSLWRWKFSLTTLRFDFWVMPKNLFLFLSWWSANNVWFYLKTIAWGVLLGLQNTLTASLQKGTTPTSLLDITQKSDSEAWVILELWGKRSTPSLPPLSSLPWPGVIAPDRVLSLSQIELNSVLSLNWIVWNRTILTFKCLQTKIELIPNWIVWNLIRR